LRFQNPIEFGYRTQNVDPQLKLDPHRDKYPGERLGRVVVPESIVFWIIVDFFS
jgi:hypothetical protein